ncbi:hypothetical protein TWF694_008867 [Orbilia ellipsospora]|uniref:Mannose-1-phosphate guanyltransferase n=1 Tax=Orbilia ellipsospora TaxID=2528407 RepID=A0AAV9XD58_9PEZI
MPSAHNSLGLTAVILCGEGTDLKPIISAQKLPKALLPVANKPMLQYPLEWVLDAGLDSIVIVCIKGQETAIKAFVKDLYATRELQTPRSKNSRPLRFPTIVGAVDTSSKTGTAETLRLPQVHSLIKNDFMVLSCDSICEIPAVTIIKEWNLLPDTIGNQRGALGVWYEVQKAKGAERDVILTAPIPRFDLEAGLRSTEARTDETTELAYLLQNFGARTNEVQDDISFRRGVFKRHPKILIQDSYRDAHIYIFPYWALKFILANPRKKLKSIKDDVISWWAKACWQGSGLQAHTLGMLSILDGSDDGSDQKSDNLSMNSYQEEEVTETTIENFLGMSTMRASNWTATEQAAREKKEINTRGWFPTKVSGPTHVDSPASGSDDQEKEFKAIKMPAYNGLFVPGIAVFKPQMTITPLATTPLIRRVDTITLYQATCLELARNPNYNTNAIHPAATVHERANVSNIDSMVGAGSQVEEKSLIKRSVIGKNVKIGAMAKIQGCVILDGAEIGSGCKLDGSIIGRFVKVGANSSLTNCKVIEDVVLRERTVEKDSLIEQSSQDDSDEESDDDIFGGGPSGGGNDDDSEEDEDDEESEDDKTTTKSVPTTTRESAAPLSTMAAGPSTQKQNQKVVAFSVPETETPKPKIESSARGFDGAADAEGEPVVEAKEELQEEEPQDEGPQVRFLDVDLQEGEEEEDEDDGDDFEPDSDDSSFCEEEYDSQFESDAAASGDDTGNLSGPEDDGGPLKSPKRLSRTFGEDMSNSVAKMASMNLANVLGEGMKEAMGDSLPPPARVEEGVEIKTDVGEEKGN